MKLYEFTVTDSLGDRSFAEIWGLAADAAHDQEMSELQLDGEDAQQWLFYRVVLVDYEARLAGDVYTFEVQGGSRA